MGTCPALLRGIAALRTLRDNGVSDPELDRAEAELTELLRSLVMVTMTSKSPMQFRQLAVVKWARP